MFRHFYFEAFWMVYLVTPKSVTRLIQLFTKHDKSTSGPLQISHKAVLTVDETGTDAAAGTTIEIMPMSLPDTMNLNRPFLVLIVEDSTKSILFMGKISDPTAK